MYRKATWRLTARGKKRREIENEGKSKRINIDRKFSRRALYVLSASLAVANNPDSRANAVNNFTITLDEISTGVNGGYRDDNASPRSLVVLQRAATRTPVDSTTRETTDGEPGQERRHILDR